MKKLFAIIALALAALAPPALASHDPVSQKCGVLTNVIFIARVMKIEGVEDAKADKVLGHLFEVTGDPKDATVRQAAADMVAVVGAARAAKTPPMETAATFSMLCSMTGGDVTIAIGGIGI